MCVCLYVRKWCVCDPYILPSGVKSQANWKCFNHRFHFLVFPFVFFSLSIFAHPIRFGTMTTLTTTIETALWNTACRWTSNKKGTWYVYSPRTDKCRIVTIRTGMVNSHMSFLYGRVFICVTYNIWLNTVTKSNQIEWSSFFLSHRAREKRAKKHTHTHENKRKKKRSKTKKQINDINFLSHFHLLLCASHWHHRTVLLVSFVFFFAFAYTHS